MSTRRWRQKLILLKIESTYGTDATPSAGNTDEVLAFDVEFDPNPQDAPERRPARPYLGNAARTVTGRHVGLRFSVELTGAGIAGDAPKWAAALRAAGFAETLTAGTDAVYELVSDGFESATVYVNIDGTQHPITGFRANASLSYSAGGVPMLQIDGLGLHVDPADAALPTVDFSAWNRGLPMTPAHTPTFTLDGFAGEVQEISLDCGWTRSFRQYMNSEAVEMLDRQPSGSVLIKAPELGTKDFFSLAKGQGNGTGSLSVLELVHGTSAGMITQLDAPTVQLLNPRYEEIGEGEAGLRMDLNPVPSDAGDDEFKITVK